MRLLHLLVVLASSSLVAACSGQNPGDLPCVDGYPSLVVQNLTRPWVNEDPVPRTYLFLADGTFTVSDAVAPCPSGAACVWSGIVVNHGTYAISTGAAEAIALTYAMPMQGPNDNLVFPTNLDWVGHCGDVSIVEQPNARGFGTIQR